MRILRAIIAIAVVLGVAAAVAAAQAPVPAVAIAVSTTASTVPPAPIAPGATRFEVSSSAERAEISVFVVAVKPGRTAADVIAALRRDPDTSFEVADIAASVDVPPGGRGIVTTEMEAGRTYLLVNDIGEERPTNWVITPLTVGGAPTGATAPEPDAQVDMRDNRFGGDTTLPRRGTIRVRHRGWAPHFAIAFPLQRGASRAAFRRALLGNSERAFGRVVDFRNTRSLTPLLTRNAVADKQVTFNRRGRYALVCFFENHQAQGMYRFVTVR